MADVYHRLQIDVVGTQQLDEIRKTLTAYNTVVRKTDQGTRSFANAANSNIKSQKEFARQTQLAAFQLTDFAVQLEGGVSASRALGQQLPQLLGSFGAIGAVLGAAVAVLAPFAKGLFETRTSLDEMEAVSKRASDAIDTYSTSLREGLGSLENVVESTGIFSDKLVELDQQLLQIQNRKAFLEMQEEIKALAALDLSSEFLDINRYDWEILQRELGATREEADQFRYTLEDIGRSTGLEEAEANVRRLRELLISITGGIENMNAAQLRVLDDIDSTLRNIEKRQAGAVNIAGEWAAKQREITSAVEQQIAQYEAYNTIMGTSAQSLDAQAIAAKVIADLMVQIAAQADDAKQQFIETVDVTGLVAAAMDGVKSSTAGAASEADALTRSLQRAAEIASSINTAAEGIEAQNAALRAQIDARLEGATAIQAEAAAQKELVRLKTEEALLNAEDPALRAAIIEAQNRQNAAIDQNLALRQQQKAINDAAAESERAYAEASKASAKIAEDNAKELAKRLEDFRKSTELVQTPLEKLQQEMADLRAEAEYLSKLKLLSPDDLEAYRLKMQEIQGEIKKTQDEMSGLEDIAGIVGNEMSSMVDSVLDGSKTIGEAFTAMIEDVLKAIAAYLIKKAILVAIDRALGGSGQTGAALAGPAPQGLHTTIFPGQPPIPSFFGNTRKAASVPSYDPAQGRTASLQSVANAVGNSVSRQGGGEVNITVNNNTSSNVTVSETTDRQGNRNITMDIDNYIDSRMRENIANGRLDRTMKATYGLRRTA